MFYFKKTTKVLAGRIFFRETRFRVLFEWLGLAKLWELSKMCGKSGGSW